MRISDEGIKREVGPERSWVIIVMQGLLGIGAMVGGGALIIDPSGNLIQMPDSLLEHSPFGSFLIPGIILLLVLGVMPMIIAISLLRRIHWKIGEKLNLYPNQYWGWTFSLYTGFALIIWIMVQVYWIQHVSVIHLVYFSWGVGIQIVTLLPGVQRRYSRKIVQC
ncbi:hypothetical protein MKY42_24525 [Paenibacillus sp. FSL W7-1088]|uniref:hypothetical protein n=1 Tax=unclassified Paenibacillus TaxID=185978 RepID=UPI0015C666EC|nr:hypothetical protein [Paenibacillus sp. E222]QLG39064.1 hypothetical protein HW560_13810 [Paenibacillus sp. E222]